MLASDLDLLKSAAESAADIALRHWRRDPRSWEKPGDAGPVSEADLEVDAHLKTILTDARPDYGWLSEETTDNASRLGKDRVFIVDPIDGTRSFLAGEKTWSHSLAVAENGRVTAAVVYLPAHDKIYTATPGGGARCNDKDLTSSGRSGISGATVLATRSNFETRYWPAGIPPIERHFRSSLAYRLALVGEGRFDAMLTFRETWEWDVAAGTLIAAEAGALACTTDGTAPRFNNPQPFLRGLVVATPGVHAGLMQALGQQFA